MDGTGRALTYTGAVGFAFVVFQGLNALHK